MEDEKKLLNILSSVDSTLCISAFKRLVRIYKKTPENEIIYKYLEEFPYEPNESTKYLIECITEFVDNEDHLVRFSRSMKLYNSIIEKILFLIKYENIQISAFVLLSRILHIKPCKDEWIRHIVDVFYTAKKSSVERMACKILISSISLNDNIDIDSIQKITLKIQMDNRQQNDLYKILNSLLYNNQKCNIKDYIFFLKNKDIVSLFRYSNIKFIEENIEEIDKRIEIISTFYIEAIEGSAENRSIFLEHLLIVFSFSTLIREEFRKSKYLDVLCNISEEEDASGYISIKLLDIILRKDES